MKKAILILIAIMMTSFLYSQSLQKLSNYKTDSITQLPLQEVVINFYIDWGVNASSGIDSTSQVILINIKQYVMTSDTTKVLIIRQRQRRISQGSDDFNRWFIHFEDFGDLIYQELINDSIQ